MVVTAINFGGTAFTSKAGVAYKADQYFTGGAVSASNATILNTSDLGLYQKQRYGAFSYSVPVANGTYSVTLNVCETYWQAAGKRKMSVTLEGVAVMTNVDLFASYGYNKAASVTFSNVKVADGNLTLGVSASVDKATLAGLVITKP